MITNKLSRQITIASFLATVMVVYRHSLNYLAFFGTWTADGVNGWVQDSIMRMTEVAVPFFFLVSGFFFFRTTSYTWKKYSEMVGKKWWGLGVPFLFWNITGMFVLLTADKSKIGANFADGLIRLLDSDWYGPLWYVRDLISMMAIAPFILTVGNKLMKISKKLVTVLLFLLIAGEYFFWIPIDCGWLSTESILFFTMGGLLQCHRCLVEKRLPMWMLVVIASLWIWQSFSGYINGELHKINTIVGIVVFWQLLDYLPSKFNDSFMKYTSYSFLIYVLHFYLIKTMKVGLGKMFFGNDVVSLLAYLLLPLITVVMIIMFGKIYKRVLPNVYKISMGGR